MRSSNRTRSPWRTRRTISSSAQPSTRAFSNIGTLVIASPFHPTLNIGAANLLNGYSASRVTDWPPAAPLKCSGLDVVRYDAESLHREFGVHFRMLGSSMELHRTPFGTIQQFLYCYCRVE